MVLTRNIIQIEDKKDILIYILRKLSETNDQLRFGIDKNYSTKDKWQTGFQQFDYVLFYHALLQKKQGHHSAMVFFRSRLMSVDFRGLFTI